MDKIGRSRDVLRSEGAVALLRKGTSYVLKSVITSTLGYYYRTISRPDSDGSLPTLIKVAASDIEYHSRLPQSAFPVNDAKSGEPLVGILSGPWDRYRKPYERTDQYRILKERFQDGKDWSEIGDYPDYDEVQAKTEFLERLYDSLDRHGYIPHSDRQSMSSAEIPKPKSSYRTVYGEQFPNECFVGIGRDGEIIRFTGAHHRIAIAKLLGIEEIPVVVVLRHREWERIREQFRAAEGTEDLPEDVRTYRGHPDLQAFETD